MYEVALVRKLKISQRSGWGIVQEALLTTQTESAKYRYRLLLLVKRGFVQFTKACFGKERDRLVVLEQLLELVPAKNDPVSQPTRGERRLLFQLYRGNKDGDDEEESRVAFEGVSAFLKSILSSGKDGLSEDILRELIKPPGPVTIEEALVVLIHWDLSGFLTPTLVEEYLKIKNDKGESLLHLAMKEGKQNIAKKLIALLEGASQLLVDRQSTILHVGAEYGSHEAVEVLLSSSRPPFTSTNTTEKNNAGIIKASIEQGNAAGDTPLAIAANNGHFSVVLSLLLVDANPNTINSHTGFTPLHYAASKGYDDIVKALVAFGANPHVRNRDGCLPSDVATKHPKTLELFEQMGNVTSEEMKCSHGGTELNSEFPLVLSIDGGGIRGLVACVLLRELEDRLRALDPRYDTLGSYFDYISGTSTGSFIALSLSHGRKTVRDITKQYFHFKDVVLTLDRPFSRGIVDNAMIEVFGEDICMADKVQPKVMIMTCKADVSPPILHIMRNYGEAQDGEKGPKERKVWEAARASSAAPTYFPAFGKFLDGGLMANNPTVDCIGEVIDDLVAEGKDPRLGLVVSVGTGSPPRRPVPGVDIPHINWLNPADIVEAAVGLKHFMQIVIDQVTASCGRQVERSISWCATMECPFYRLNPPLEKNIDMAEYDNKILVDMMFQSVLYATKHSHNLNSIANILYRRTEASRKK